MSSSSNDNRFAFLDEVDDESSRPKYNNFDGPSPSKAEQEAHNSASGSVPEPRDESEIEKGQQEATEEQRKNPSLQTYVKQALMLHTAD